MFSTFSKMANNNNKNDLKKAALRWRSLKKQKSSMTISKACPILSLGDSDQLSKNYIACYIYNDLQYPYLFIPFLLLQKNC